MSISRHNKGKEDFPLPDDPESNVELINFFMPTYQRARFRKLTSMISEMFDKRGDRSELSNAIISFLHFTSPGTMCDIFSQLEDVPFEDADEEIQEILKKEFIK